MGKNEGMPTPADYRMAIASQDACNLSGIVFSFANVMQRICNESHELGHGTDERNHHPICVLYATQIAHLAGLSVGSDLDKEDVYRKAYFICEQRGKEPA